MKKQPKIIQNPERLAAIDTLKSEEIAAQRPRVIDEAVSGLEAAVGFIVPPEAVQQTAITPDELAAKRLQHQLEIERARRDAEFARIGEAA